MGVKIDTTSIRSSIGNFNSDDVELHEKGINRIGNILVNNESYMHFEDMVMPILDKLYEKQKRWAVSDLLREIGLTLNDENWTMKKEGSILTITKSFIWMENVFHTPAIKLNSDLL